MEFRPGDCVKVKQSGDIGIVSDIVKTSGGYLYGVENSAWDKAKYFYEDEIEAKAEDKQYTFHITVANNIVYAVMMDGEEGNEIARGHGHIFHDGKYGVAQAASYAMKRIKDYLEGGNY